MATVAIIGGGPAGVAAATWLRDCGHDVQLFEQGHRLGGRSASESVDGFSIDIGTTFLASSYRATLELAERCSVPVAPVRYRWALQRGDERVEVVPGRPWTYLKLGFEPRTLAMMIRRYVVSRSRPRCDLFDGASLASRDDGRTVDEATRSSVPEWVSRELIDPVLEQFWNCDSREAAAALLFALAHQPAFAHFVTPVPSVGALFDRAARGVDVVLGTTVTAIEVDGSGRLRLSSSRDHLADVDALLICTDAHAAFGLLGQRHHELADVTYASCTHVAFGFDEPIWPKGMRASVVTPVGERREHVSAVALQSGKGAHVAPRGTELVSVYLRHEASVASSENAAVRVARDALGDVLGRRLRTARISFVRTYRHARAFPVVRPGSMGRLDGIEGRLLPSIGVAGDYFAAPTVETAVRSGRTAAARAAAYLRGGQ